MAANVVRTSPSGPKARKKIGKVMGEFKRGTLHSGRGRGRRVVKKASQAKAIAMSEGRKAQRGKRY